MNTSKKYFSIGILVIFAILTRLMPHPFNFTAIGALALFSGSVISNKKFAFILPFIAMIIADAFLGFHSSMIPVYLCFGMTVWIGMTVIKKINLLSVPSGAFLSSILFFLVTNLPFWYADISLYPLTWQGTVESYTQALPFFANQIAGDLFYSATLFGAYYILRQHYFEPVNS